MPDELRDALARGLGDLRADDRPDAAPETPDSIWRRLMDRADADACPEMVAVLARRTFNRLNGLPVDGRDRRAAWVRIGMASAQAYADFQAEQQRVAAGQYCQQQALS